ncbi:MAG TPA: hypothetical protein VE954_41020 [Oligoflexus sp.]|uniref:hypothetical protein n=1 Tax=Oligoflexus sp. TaxID=1971216 RepID=UPI002D38CEA5|nr:hypothetical protein [Oligoflexus sp.]HYX39524.1 hypothetical protein [Oligoflexus sp.]
MAGTWSRLTVLVCFFAAAGCQTLNSGAPVERPQITRDMKLEDAYRNAVAYGDDTLPVLRELARDRNQTAELHKIAEGDLLQEYDRLPTPVLLNVAHIYRVTGSSMNPDVLNRMARSRQEAVRRIGWRLAATRPSAEMGRTIETILSEALTKGREGDMLVPEMASAVQENGIKSAYSYLVLGLMQQGAPEYANAMLALDAGKASTPFIDYLNRADLEDLRQLNQKTVNLLTCTVIFRFFSENPLPLNHPGMPILFQYAVSRNRALSEMAFAVLEKHIPDNRLALAVLLSRQPVPVQIAFIESSQRETTANIRLFLDNMKEVAQQKEVIEELNAQQGAVEK